MVYLFHLNCTVVKYLFLFAFSYATQAAAQGHSHALGRALRFPDVPGFVTLTTDLHQHTVFSDGSVWPDIRVMEALMDGLDAISLPEPLESHPPKPDLPHPDRNRSYQLALAEAKDHRLLIVNGSEITRRMPPGHCNAIFLSDANQLLIGDSLEVFRKAKEQGAFVFWNHPHWTAQRRDGVATLTPFHRLLIREGLLHGIEVVNEHTYSEEALQLALDHNLTIMGTSDIHRLIDWEFDVPKGGHRPITLVFANERTEASLKEALIERRTVVFFKNMLIGRSRELLPLLQQCITVVKAQYPARADVLAVTLENKSSVELVLRNESSFRFHTDGDLLILPPGATRTVEVKTLTRLSSLELRFRVLSAVEAPRQHPLLVLPVTPAK